VTASPENGYVRPDPPRPDRIFSAPASKHPFRRPRCHLSIPGVLYLLNMRDKITTNGRSTEETGPSGTSRGALAYRTLPVPAVMVRFDTSALPTDHLATQRHPPFPTVSPPSRSALPVPERPPLSLVWTQNLRKKLSLRTGSMQRRRHTRMRFAQSACSLQSSIAPLAAFGEPVLGISPSAAFCAHHQAQIRHLVQTRSGATRRHPPSHPRAAPTWSVIPLGRLSYHPSPRWHCSLSRASSRHDTSVSPVRADDRRGRRGVCRRGAYI
jgi:hypothetical protein